MKKNNHHRYHTAIIPYNTLRVHYRLENGYFYWPIYNWMFNHNVAWGGFNNRGVPDERNACQFRNKGHIPDPHVTFNNKETYDLFMYEWIINPIKKQNPITFSKFDNYLHIPLSGKEIYYSSGGYRPPAHIDLAKRTSDLKCSLTEQLGPEYDLWHMYYIGLSYNNGFIAVANKEVYTWLKMSGAGSINDL